MPSIMSSLANQFLIAMPNLADPHFFHTVTYICEHNEHGALGIVINRPMEIKLSDVLNQMTLITQHSDIANLPVFSGGPVQPERGFVIHQPRGTWESSLFITEDIAITTSQDILTAIAGGEGPAKLLIALGYAGWGPGQLEKEIADNAWLSNTADPKVLFELPPIERWAAAAKLMGIDLNLLSAQAGHA